MPKVNQVIDHRLHHVIGVINKRERTGAGDPTKGHKRKTSLGQICHPGVIGFDPNQDKPVNLVGGDGPPVGLQIVTTAEVCV